MFPTTAPGSHDQEQWILGDVSDLITQLEEKPSDQGIELLGNPSFWSWYTGILEILIDVFFIIGFSKNGNMVPRRRRSWCKDHSVQIQTMMGQGILTEGYIACNPNNLIRTTSPRPCIVIQSTNNPRGLWGSLLGGKDKWVMFEGSQIRNGIYVIFFFDTLGAQ